VMKKRRTASGVFANQLLCEYEVVNVGLLRNLDSGDSSTCLVQASKRFGTDNLRVSSAMTDEDFEHVWEVGQARASAAAEKGCRLVIGGEMGIGNTTSASCLVSWFAGVTINQSVGRGAGIDETGMARKREVVADAIKRVRRLGDIDVKRAGRELGGLEIVALAGFYARAAELRLTIILDGFIATSAALLANAICPNVTQQMIAGHRSTEPGHLGALTHLGLSPVLELNLRLGEATGALTALPLVDLAAAMMTDMATLSELASP
jgi:nicotinate-nucleotide--dimethylbenzimidazole phosphoribosyltransferase